MCRRPTTECGEKVMNTMMLQLKFPVWFLNAKIMVARDVPVLQLDDFQRGALIGVVAVTLLV